jgi:integrase
MTKRTTTRRPFGFIRLRADRRKPYLAGFNPPAGGPEVTKAFATEDEAEVWLAEQHVAVARGAFVSPTGAKTLYRDYWSVFLAESHLRPSSVETYQAHGRRHILPVFGHRPLGSLRRNEIQAWVNRLPVAPRTTQTILRVLQSCLTAAVTDELIPKSPAAGVRAPTARRRTLVVPTAEEVEALADAMYARYRLAVYLGAEVGLREGEILGLRMQDLDLLGRKLTVCRQAQTLSDGVHVDLPPKTDAAYRTISLDPETVEVIALHLATYPVQAGGLVFTSAAGKPVRRNLFGEAWTSAKQRTKIDRPLRFHDLRHRYASVLIADGCDALTVKTLMGHSSITETYDTYGHLFPNQAERAAQAVGAVIHRASRTTSRTKPDGIAGQEA